MRILKTVLAVLLIMSTHLLHAQIVDVHSHNVTEAYIETLKVHDALLDEGFPLPAWDTRSHLQFMDGMGIDYSILTMPAPQPYFGDTEECKKAVRKYNEESAALARAYPDRFGFCAALSLPDVDAAIEEAVYALDVLGAKGVKLATNSRGQYLGDEILDPLMEVLNERRAVIIIHPHKPVPLSEQTVKNLPLASYDYLAETTRAVENMIARNVLARYPYLKVVVPHCGSFLPLAIPRMKSLYPAMLSAGLMQPIDWEKNLAGLYYDLAGSHNAEVIKMMLTITTPDHIFYGSDYPYQPVPALKASLQRMQDYLRSDPVLAPYAEDFLHGNAERLFGLASDGEKRTTIPSLEDRVVRIARITVKPECLEEYMEYAAEVGRESCKNEPGVISLYSTASKEHPNRITILEIYADRASYERHLTTPWFKKYKEGTASMVESLELIDSKALVPEMKIK